MGLLKRGPSKEQLRISELEATNTELNETLRRSNTALQGNRNTVDQLM